MFRMLRIPLWNLCQSCIVVWIPNTGILYGILWHHQKELTAPQGDMGLWLRVTVLAKPVYFRPHPWKFGILGMMMSTQYTFLFALSLAPLAISLPGHRIYANLHHDTFLTLYRIPYHLDNSSWNRWILASFLLPLFLRQNPFCFNSMGILGS